MKRVRCVFRVRCADAEQVFLMGTFNNWSTTSLPMRPVAKGGVYWEACLDLPAGRYSYCYLAVDRDAEKGLRASDAPGWPIRVLGFVSNLDVADYLDWEVESRAIGHAGLSDGGDMN